AGASATVLIAPQGCAADVAQLVEHHLAKVRVAGSNPVVRSRRSVCPRGMPLVAEWPSGLGKGLQSPVHGFDSRLRLHDSPGHRAARPDEAVPLCFTVLPDGSGLLCPKPRYLAWHDSCGIPALPAIFSG